MSAALSVTPLSHHVQTRFNLLAKHTHTHVQVLASVVASLLPYRGSSSLQPVLGVAGRDKLYSEAEAEGALRQYAVSNGLAATTDASEMALDRLLISALYNKTEQPGAITHSCWFWRI